MDLYKLSAYELRNLFLDKKVKATEITEYFLKRIEKNNKKLGAFLTVLSERAMQKAKELDQKNAENKPMGRLAGVPIAIKDNTHIEKEITTCASQFLTNYKAPFSATAVKLLEEQDAILVGKTNLDEFAMGSSNENSSFYPSYNPWNLDCTPGGSSGGSASAVASRISLIATGSDTGGSIRQPSAFCGVVGFKPTYGRVSRYGLVAFGSSLDQIGPIATNVKDIGLTMEVLGKHCPHDAMSLEFPAESYIENLREDLSEITVGVPWHFLESLNKEAHDNFVQSIETMKSLGANIIDVNLDILKSSIAVYYILATAEASTNLARFDGIRYGVRSKDAKNLEEVYDLSRDQGFGYEVKKRILLGTYVLSSGFQEAFYKKAQKVRTLVIQSFDAAFSNCDCICMPTAPITSFKLGTFQDPIGMYLQDIFTISANLAGLPAISVPSGFDKDNKPFGLQFLGPQLHDAPVVSYAHAYEQATKFSSKIPPLFDKEF
ncbi:MAG: Asp-tRNA(Asn)/Glu-tRNA(Gln) amidotransferase GatCAB subunit A [Chlamydiae bacterium CG10_big_fil_rev_8_21_14_0_10_35_9]|nr:MAG: Asp-tRNA(Asn)/Glu-tRNA(Gln) amidotransferase GatCAB subunit A [Chlamydiae bacterium CG10_big_fil_rev_8_21_14_0_10_35_9]